MFALLLLSWGFTYLGMCARFECETWTGMCSVRICGARHPHYVWVIDIRCRSFAYGAGHVLFCASLSRCVSML